jgi:hypothetical protein
VTSSPSCLRIVPVGLNYINGHRFRSRVFVDVADPIVIRLDSEMVRLYREGGDSKKAACTMCMDLVREGLDSVTVEAEDAESLKLFWVMRRLYSANGQISNGNIKQNYSTLDLYSLGQEGNGDDAGAAGAASPTTATLRQARALRTDSLDDRGDRNLSSKVRLTRAFTEGYALAKERPEVQALLEKVRTL